MDTILKNTIFLDKLYNFNNNYKKLLKINTSLSYNNCKNGSINILNKINLIEIKNCNNIDIHINKLISGFIITNSNNINIYIESYQSLNSIDITKSKIIILKKNIDIEKIKNNYCLYSDTKSIIDYGNIII